MKNKTIIITGAGSGIGKATAELFLKNNYSVALIGRNLKNLEKVAALSNKAKAFQCDVSNLEMVESTFNTILSKWKHLDVLFNNAGIGNLSNSIDKISIEEWKSVIDINLTGSFICSKIAFKIMKEQSPQGGRIINNGSVSAHVPRPGSSPYTTSKHGITGLTKSISLDGRQYNIACSQIDIGNAKTEMTQKMEKGIMQANGSTQIEPTMDVKHVSQSVLNIANLPLDANVQFMTIMASSMPYIGRG